MIFQNKYTIYPQNVKEMLKLPIVRQIIFTAKKSCQYRNKPTATNTIRCPGNLLPTNCSHTFVYAHGVAYLFSLAAVQIFGGNGGLYGGNNLLVGCIIAQ